MKLGKLIRHSKGERFGRLVIISNQHRAFPERGSRKAAWWRCLCDCGKKVWVRGTVLRIGKTRSCGCLHKEMLYLSSEEAAKSHARMLVYRSWEKMLVRCYNKKSSHYNNYGGRGISVCKRWRESFDSFYADMGARKKGLTLDRINNNGNYEPGNCRWATWEEQAYNRRNTVWVVYDQVRGKETLGQLSQRFGMDRNIVHQRVVVHGWDLHKALTTPVRAKRKNRSA